ncbi:MAG: magnesium chelatase, partial [Bacteroidetes bacterium GWE2_40_15]
MLSRTYCASCIGIEAITVTIEVDVSQGISFFLVGLPDSAVRESQQRISTALMTIGARIPGKKIIVNMAPADLRKEGSSFDLAIAVGILAASEQYIFNSLSSYIIMGELALDGSLRAVPGALPIAVHAREESFRGCIFPVESAMEASDIDGIVIYAAHNLADVISILLDDGVISPVKPYSEDACFDGADVNSPLWQSSFAPDFAEIKGQEHAKRGLEIAAAGGHNLLMCGIPGSGKSLMAKAFAGILPPLGRDESIETSMIYSVAGRGHSFKGLIRERPFRAPHHSSSAIAIAGGGTKAFPGEISLAHNGVLFMDELPEFSRHLLELLRQPLEERVISLSRANYKVTYPCNFQLLASMNPCPCGFYGDSAGRCTCSPYMISRYAAKVSGPLLDRIEMR